MINEPRVITQSSFQLAWKEAVSLLSMNEWELRNLIVHIKDPTKLDDDFHQEVRGFCREHSLLDPKHVAYTIFPHKLYETRRNAEQLFHSYNRDRGLYERLQRRPRRGWGTYFRRMTYYEFKGSKIRGPMSCCELLHPMFQTEREKEGSIKGKWKLSLQGDVYSRSTRKIGGRSYGDTSIWRQDW